MASQTTHNDLTLGQILVKAGEVKGATEDDPTLCALSVTTGFAVLIMGNYLTPKPAPTPPRFDRFLMNAADHISLDTELDKLERVLGNTRTAGLLQLEARILAPELYSQKAAKSSSTSADPMAAGQDDEDAIRGHIETQKKLAQRMEVILRGGAVKWYKYPVCHEKCGSRWTHGMSVYSSRKVYCQSVDASGKNDEVRVIAAAKSGKEEEDSGRRCC
ncbi:uncharacterized protein PG986_010378 [Apiospora aurea]|uniref:Uncharacterized protein n=1 Tax=Apiospora aurea TaxID=335848 RepID=A0ABR1Q295_9PEZI